MTPGLISTPGSVLFNQESDPSIINRSYEYENVTREMCYLLQLVEGWGVRGVLRGESHLTNKNKRKYRIHVILRKTGHGDTMTPLHLVSYHQIYIHSLLHHAKTHSLLL